MKTQKRELMGKTPTCATTLTREQLAVVRNEFPEEQWTISKAIRCMIADYFEARDIDFPPDANTSGGWRTRRNRSGHE